jgi:excisionase family DNA binding protein
MTIRPNSIGRKSQGAVVQPRTPKTRHDSTPRPVPPPRRDIDRAWPVEHLPEFLSPEEFRTYVGIGRATCYELIRRGQIPSVRFGRSIRIPKSALQRSFAAGGDA